MKTSIEWWNETKHDGVKLVKWLKNQYHGELLASIRLQQFLVLYGLDTSFMNYKIVECIAKEEQDHAQWVGSLLTERGIPLDVFKTKTERYWDKTLKGITSWESGCAVASLAEGMRLERIRAIVNDPSTPNDIRNVFKAILPQEIQHEKAFRMMTTQEEINKATENHKQGMNALGLTL